MIEEKIVDLLKSKIQENVDLAMSVCRVEYPFLWVALLGFTGLGEISSEILNEVAKKRLFNVGTRVKYKGMDGSPIMVVIKAEMSKQHSLVGTTYITNLTCKYYNKSTQSFSTTIDRVECFELIDIKENDDNK